MVAFECFIISQVKFQSCMEKMAADELLGNGLGFAQLDVLDELDVGGGVQVSGECLEERGCERAIEGCVEPVGFQVMLVNWTCMSRTCRCWLSRRCTSVKWLMMWTC